jgi:hypothetical protein
MLIEKVIDHYIEVGKKHPGNPFRLSNSGRCARALAYQRFQSIFKPEPMPARVLMVLEEGKRVDKWLKEEFRKHCAKSWGSEEKEFYIEVDGIKIFGHADGVPALEPYGRTVAELKSMSNYGFRNALQGKVDYGYRCQLNSYVVGGGLNNALWVCYRKETSHLLELFCSKKIEKIETRILTPSGGWLQYTPEAPIEDDEWQRAEVTHPFDPKLHEQVVERFRKVIHATPKNLPDREYGPKLICEKCDGNGFYLTEKRQIKKPCTACSETGKILEPRLGFPCTTCRFKKHCWPQAKLQFDGRKPVWVVPREVAEEIPVIHPHENSNGQEFRGSPQSSPVPINDQRDDVELF